MEQIFLHKRAFLLSFVFGAVLLGVLARVLGQGRVSAWAFEAALGLFLLSLWVE